MLRYFEHIDTQLRRCDVDARRCAGHVVHSDCLEIRRGL